MAGEKTLSVELQLGTWAAALGMLINANKRVKEKNGQLRLTNIKPNIYEVFVITKLNKLFRILGTRTEGLASFTA